MKIPKENFVIKVGPFEYKVKYSDDVADEGNVFGSTHNNDQVIFLDPKRPWQKVEQTFIHELLHACTFVSGLMYRFEDKEQKPTEEDVCRELSMTLFQVFIDNPNIFNGRGGDKYVKNKKTKSKKRNTVRSR